MLLTPLKALTLRVFSLGEDGHGGLLDQILFIKAGTQVFRASGLMPLRAARIYWVREKFSAFTKPRISHEIFAISERVLL